MDIQSLFKQTPPIGLILLSNFPQNSSWARKVAIIIRYSKKGHPIGLCINDPLHLTLEDFDASAQNHLASVPVYQGGPIHPNKLILTGFVLDPKQHKLHWRFNCNPIDLPPSESASINYKAFRGYIDWSEGQLTDEIQKKLWLPIPLTFQSILEVDNPKLWDTLMLKFYPFLLKNPDSPENPSLN